MLELFAQGLLGDFNTHGLKWGGKLWEACGETGRDTKLESGWYQIWKAVFAMSLTPQECSDPGLAF